MFSMACQYVIDIIWTNGKMIVLNAIIGENMISRLYQELRENRGLVYSIFSEYDFF